MHAKVPETCMGTYRVKLAKFMCQGRHPINMSTPAIYARPRTPNSFLLYVHMISQLVIPVGARCKPSLTFYAIRYTTQISKFTSCIGTRLYFIIHRHSDTYFSRPQPYFPPSEGGILIIIKNSIFPDIVFSIWFGTQLRGGWNIPVNFKLIQNHLYWPCPNNCFTKMMNGRQFRVV